MLTTLLSDRLHLAAEPLGQTGSGAPILKVCPTSVRQADALSVLALDQGFRLVQVPQTLPIPRVGPAGTCPVVAVSGRHMGDGVHLDLPARIALVDAGVTHHTLARHLEGTGLTHHAHLFAGDREMVFDALCGGPGALANMAGDLNATVTGVEFVRPGGGIVRLGAASLSDSWFSRSPLPDLFALVLGTRGHAGIVTRVAVKLDPVSRGQAFHTLVLDNMKTFVNRVLPLCRHPRVFFVSATRRPDGGIGCAAGTWGRSPLPLEWTPGPKPDVSMPSGHILAAAAPGVLAPAWEAVETILARQTPWPEMTAVAYQGGTGFYLCLAMPKDVPGDHDLAAALNRGGGYLLPVPGLDGPVEPPGPLSRAMGMNPNPEELR